MFAQHPGEKKSSIHLKLNGHEWLLSKMPHSRPSGVAVKYEGVIQSLSSISTLAHLLIFHTGATKE